MLLSVNRGTEQVKGLSPQVSSGLDIFNFLHGIIIFPVFIIRVAPLSEQHEPGLHKKLSGNRRPALIFMEQEQMTQCQPASREQRLFSSIFKNHQFDKDNLTLGEGQGSRQQIVTSQDQDVICKQARARDFMMINHNTRINFG